MTAVRAKVNDVLSPKLTKDPSPTKRQSEKAAAMTEAAIRIKVLRICKPDGKSEYVSALSGKRGIKTYFVEYVRCDDTGKPIKDAEHRFLSDTDLRTYFDAYVADKAGKTLNL